MTITVDLPELDTATPSSDFIRIVRPDQEGAVGGVEYKVLPNNMASSDPGASEYLLKTDSDGGLALDTDTLFVDASADRVGVGTASPDANLDIESSSNTDIDLVSTDTNGTAWTIQSLGNVTNREGNLEFIEGGQIRLALATSGNVGIGTASPDAAALLELSATDKGLLLPRMTNTQMNNISSPPAGLVIFNTTSGAIYFYDGTAWEQVDVVA